MVVSSSYYMEIMKEKCKNCNHEWNYKGKARFYATCPTCLRKVKLKGGKKDEKKKI